MNKNKRPQWEPPGAIKWQQTWKEREFIGLTFKSFKSKGIEIIGEINDGRSIPISERDKIEELLPDGFFLSFVWDYWYPGGFGFVTIERGIKIYTPLDVDKCVEFCGQMFTIKCWKNLSTKISRLSPSCEHEPYIKILDQDSKNGLSVDLSTIPQH